MTNSTQELLTSKQLAAVLNRSARFVYRMRNCGFEMPGGTATLDEARQWLRTNYPFHDKQQTKTQKKK